MSILKYFSKNLWRNKKQWFLIILGITIGTSLFTGINVSMDYTAEDVLRENFSSIFVDFSLKFDRSPRCDINLATELERITPLKDSFTEISNIGAFMSNRLSNTVFNFQNEAINWSYYEENNFSKSLFQRTEIYAVDESFLESDIIRDIFYFENLSSLELDNNISEIYIDLSTANKNNLSIGQKIVIGSVFSDRWDIPELFNLYSEENITIGGFFSIKNEEMLEYFFPSFYRSNNDYSMVFTTLYTENIFAQNLDEGGCNHRKGKINIVTDHQSYDYLSPDSIRSFSSDLIDEIEDLGFQYEFELRNNINFLLNTIEGQINQYRVFFLIIFTPVLILGWYIVKTTYMVIYSNRRREIGLFKSWGGSNKQIKTIFILENLVFGSIGGALGVLVGYFSAGFIYSLNSPLHPSFTPELYFSLMSSVNIPTLIVGILIGISISFFSSYNHIKSYSKLKIVDALEKYNPEIHTKVKINKSDYIIFFTSAILIGISFFTDSRSEGYLTGFSSLSIFYSVIRLILPPLMPILPFVFIIKGVHILCNISLKLFIFITTKIGKLINRNTSHLSSRYILRNMARSTKIITIMTLSFSFLMVVNVLYYSQIQYEHDTRLVYYGGDTNIEITPNGQNPTFNITEEYIIKLEDNISLEIDSILIQEFSKAIIPETPENDLFLFIDIEDFQQKYENFDRFIVGGNSEEIFSILKSQPNTTIVSSRFIRDTDLKVGDTIKDNSYNINLTIIGIFYAFPGVNPDANFMAIQSTEYVIICQKNMIQDASIEKFQLLIQYNNYNDIIELESLDEKLFTALYQIDPTILLSIPFPRSIITSNIINSSVNFLSIEKFYFLTLVSIGISVIIYSSVEEKSRELGMLRSRGFDKITIFKIELSEIATFLVLSISISFIGIFPAIAINTLLSGITYSYIPRMLIFPIWVIIFELIISAVIFTAIASISIYIVLKKSNIGRIAEIFRTT